MIAVALRVDWKSCGAENIDNLTLMRRSDAHRGGLVMVLAKNSICDFGRKAYDFALKGVDGKIWTLGDVRGEHWPHSG